ncbi:MAG: hypothetical protein HC924_16670 [Synechococcaceae cyanobacterium SM2_3_2]|nr:hypothetical protein [Synechococcaceae cyanobacterium SM2_3_2]
MNDADDEVIRSLANRFITRELPKCIDIRNQVQATLNTKDEDQIKRSLALIKERIEEAFPDADQDNNMPKVLIDEASRNPYKSFQESKASINQIHIRLSENTIAEMALASPVVASIKKFLLFRIYYFDSMTKNKIYEIISNVINGEN